MSWIQKNFKKIIYVAFLVPILAVAGVSISHVTTWYGLSNPMSWAVYLSIGIEIAALSAVEHALSASPSRPAAAVAAAIFLNFLNNCAPLERLVL